MSTDPGPGRPLSPAERRRRARHLRVWRLVNPGNQALVGVAPWWVVLETRRRRGGGSRRTPLARGPMDGDTAWLISVHGRHSHWVRDLEADPAVRIRLRGRWHAGRAEVRAYDPDTVRRFSRYARMGPRLLGLEPVLVAVRLRDG